MALGDQTREFLERFQFLIGKLQIIEFGVLHVYNTVFQFLIGKLQIQKASLIRIRRILFQFLIGKLQISIEQIALFCCIYSFNSS